MTSKLVVNTIEADTGISSVSFASSISLSSTSVFHFSDAGVNIGADTNISRAGNGILAFNINGSEKIRIDSVGRLLVNRTAAYASSSERLSVNGMTSIQGSSTSTANLYVFNTNTTADGTVQPYIFLHDGSGIRGGLGLQYSTANFIINAQSVIQFRTGATGVGGSEKLRIGSEGNLALGGTNTSAFANQSHFFIGSTGNLYADTPSGTGKSLSLSNNAYINTSGNWVYRVGDKASNIYQYDGIIGFRIAGTGSAGNTISWSERLRITNNGQLLVGTTSSGANVRAVFQGYSGGGDNFQARVQFQTNQATNLSDGQHLANLLFTNASNSVGAQIDVKADAAWGTNDYPGRIEFKTTADGASSPTTRMIIKNDGIVNIGVDSPQYAKKVNIQGGNDATLSLSNQDYTGHAAGSQSGIEGRLQCGNSQWSTSGVRFKKENGTAGDKHTRLELYATDGYSNKTGLIVHPDGEVTKPIQPMCSFIVASTTGGNYMTHNAVLTNNGNHFNTSNNRFVCPVAGFYYASIMVMSNNQNTTMDLELHKNGSNPGNILVPYSAPTGGQYNQAVGSCIIECSANDYLQFKMNSGSVYQGRHSNITFCLLA